MKPIRVLLADDHTLFRVGIRTLLQQLPGVEVVAEAGEGRDALHLIETHQPEVVFLDIAMPGLNGLEVAAQVAKSWPQVHIVMLSMHATEEYVLQALRVGAAGYVLKTASPAELEFALHAVTRGETYLSPAVSKHLVTEYVKRVGEEPWSPERLTPRQREILQLIAERHSTKEIAQRLRLSVKTVETHRSQLMERLDIHDVAGLVRYAIRSGLVQADR